MAHGGIRGGPRGGLRKNRIATSGWKIERTPSRPWSVEREARHLLGNLKSQLSMPHTSDGAPVNRKMAEEYLREKLQRGSPSQKAKVIKRVLDEDYRGLNQRMRRAQKAFDTAAKE